MILDPKEPWTMPALNNPRTESFARPVAAGATFNDAYEDADFGPGEPSFA